MNDSESARETVNGPDARSTVRVTG
jgi:hypothetical protein